MKVSRLHVSVPVRRKLFCASIAYITGIYTALAVCLPGIVVYFSCALFLALSLYRLRHRKSAFLFVIAALFIFGNYRAGYELRLRDEPTSPGAFIEGTIWRIESDNRVCLKDVLIDGERTLNRPAAVTLMQEKDELGNPIGELPAFCVGQRICGTGRLFTQREKRNPGGIDWRIQSLCKGYDLSGYILPGWQAKGERAFSFEEIFRQARKGLSERIEDLFGEGAPLFCAMVIGDRSDMDNDLIEAMRLTGIVHILTISGMHMSLAAYALHELFCKLRLGRRLRFALQAVLLGCYAGLTGYAIGTVRAYLMAMIRACAAANGRRYDSLTALGAAALVMTLVRPVWALSASFQFSFTIVLGIQLVSGQVAEAADRIIRCPEMLRRVLRLASLTISAQFVAIPMQLMYYGYIPVFSMPMNLICGFFVPVLMLGGWSILGASLFFSRAAYLAAGVFAAVAGLLEEISLSAASVPWGIVRLPAPDGATLLVVLMLLFAVSVKVYIGKYRKHGCIMLLALASLLYAQRFNPQFRYVQLDVGQGDGAVLRKNRKAVLIDVGPEDERAVLQYLRHEGLYVDLVILSHPDEDHAGALETLLDSDVKFKRMAVPENTLEENDSWLVSNALMRAEEMGIEIEKYDKGDTIVSDAFSFSVLSPDERLRGSNERSLVLYTEVDGIRILTLGDLPDKCEMEQVPTCDVLKVAHHGSRYATSPRLIAQAKPKAAIISVGANSYGHPTDRVLEDLWDAGADVWRTDFSGCITVASDGTELNVTPYIH